MKSDRRSTPDVRIKRSSGGSFAVNMCLESVAGVMSSGEGYTGVVDATAVDESGFTSGDSALGEVSEMSGCSVVEEETEDPSRGSDVRDDKDVVLEDGE